MFYDAYLLNDFANSFFGYGDFNAKYWFVGMEEGGGDSFDSIDKRLQVWRDRGRQPLEDLPEYSRCIGVNQFFEDNAKLQSTWSKLIRVYLSAHFQSVTTEAVRHFQRTTFGRRTGDTALIELLPLPSPSTMDWLYSRYCTDTHFKSREAYYTHFASLRANRIRLYLTEHKPKAVIFYGKSYKKWQQGIAGTPLEEIKELGILWGRSSDTLFIVTSHPVARGVTNKYFEQVGHKIASFRSVSPAALGPTCPGSENLPV